MEQSVGIDWYHTFVYSPQVSVSQTGSVFSALQSRFSFVCVSFAGCARGKPWLFLLASQQDKSCNHTKSIIFKPRSAGHRGVSFDLAQLHSIDGLDRLARTSRTATRSRTTSTGYSIDTREPCVHHSGPHRRVHRRKRWKDKFSAHMAEVHVNGWSADTKVVQAKESHHFARGI